MSPATPTQGTSRNVWPGHIAGIDFDGPHVRVAGIIPIVARVTPAAVAQLNPDHGIEVWGSVKATEIAG